MKRVPPALTASAMLVMLLPGAAVGEPLALSSLPAPSVAARASGVSAEVKGPFAAAGLGYRVSVSIIDASTGSALYRKTGGSSVLPASTMKLITAVTALSVLPAETTLRTTVVTNGTIAGGVLTGDLILVGGGDSTLSSLDTSAYPAPARLSALVEAVRRRGITSVAGGIVVDAAAYTGPLLEPTWKPTYISEGSVAPVSALMVDGARSRPGSTRGARSATPDIVAGRRFATLLKARGIVVAGGVTRGAAGVDATELAAVESARVPALVERMLLRSDNDLAEALLRRAAVARGLPASFAGGAAVARQVLEKLGLDLGGVVIRDGSGLSRADRVSTDLLTAVLRLAAAPDHPELRPVLSGLPVAGFNGTLVRRYRDAPTSVAAGRVRAKTGTLNNVTTLAGTVVTESGQLLVFAASADQVPSASVTAASKLLDLAVVAVAACGCR